MSCSTRDADLHDVAGAHRVDGGQPEYRRIPLVGSVHGDTTQRSIAAVAAHDGDLQTVFLELALGQQIRCSLKTTRCPEPGSLSRRFKKRSSGHPLGVEGEFSPRGRGTLRVILHRRWHLAAPRSLRARDAVPVGGCQRQRGSHTRHATSCGSRRSVQPVLIRSTIRWLSVSSVPGSSRPGGWARRQTTLNGAGASSSKSGSPSTQRASIDAYSQCSRMRCASPSVPK